MRLSQGDAAPAFTRTGNDGNQYSLDDFAGRKLAIYFYPAAFTPGCTTESCDFRDNHRALEAAGYEILGVSPDPVEDLDRFRAEYELPFPLLSDENHSMADSYGAWGMKKNYGKEYEGLIRSTIVIDDGVVSHAWYNVRAKGHVGRVASELID